MTTQKRDYIMDHTGADDWQQVVDEFERASLADVRGYLDYYFTEDDNEKLAQMIYEEVNR